MQMEIGESRHVNWLLWVSLCLCGVSLFLITHRKYLFHDSKDYFVPPMTVSEKKEMMDLLKYFLSILDSNDIEYFGSWGTLLGSVRHHGPIPWDDDIDILIDVSKKVQLSQVIKKLNPTYFLYNGTDLFAPYGQWKFFKHNGSRSFIHRPFRWPYIDLWFYHENKTHLINDKLPNLVMEKVHVYPLVERPFGGFSLKTPCNVSESLRSYNIEMCVSRSFSHIFEVPLYNWRQRVLPCTELYQSLPFVFLSTKNGSRPYYTRNGEFGLQNEVLKVGNSFLSNFTVFQPKCFGK